MKLKYFIPSFIAVLAVLVGCSTDDSITLLDEVQVSSSYVAISTDGGSTPITVTAKDEWSIDTTAASGCPAWLKVSPVSGAAGQTEVTFSAGKTEDGRTATVYITCAGKKQTINVIQGLSSIPQATVAEVMAGPESKTYRVTGTVTAITNTSYGNLYINDGTSDTDLYIYGLFNAKGQYPSAATGGWESFGISVGDEITVVGSKVVYSGTVEFKDATLVGVNKSLISASAPTYFNLNSEEVESLPSEGGYAQVAITCTSGNAVEVVIPEDAKSWLSTAFGASSTSIMLKATANTGAGRSADVTFKTTDGVKEYTSVVTISQEGLGGTKELPYTIEEAISYIQTLGTSTSPTQVYIKGFVSQFANNGEFGAKYGNGTFWLSSDGKYNDDKSKDFEAYRVLWLGNQKWVEGNATLAPGAEVVICATVKAYNGVAETASGYVYSVNGVTTDANGIGTAASPFNALGAVAAAKAGTSANVYVSGKVSKVVSAFSANYGNASFYMSADGSYADDKSKDFEAYRVLYLGNRKWVEGDTQIADGDDVTIYGPLTTYNGTAETSSGKAYIVNLNGRTE